MYIFDLEEPGFLKDIVLENLKTLGIRCRIPKKIKENEKENIYLPEYQIFEKPLHLLKFCNAPRLNGVLIEVPEFLAEACAVIERDIKTEGIFRRAGSTCKQRERKLLINQGEKVNSGYHVFDACSLVKQFFRELPQPLIPHSYQEIILSCLLLSSQPKQVEALMLVCLLLPLENLKTLAFFMEFLFKVSKYSSANKMSRKNLAIILTPTLMPAQKGGSNNLDMAHHFKVLELLIEHSEKIGVLPEYIEGSLATEKWKKKKRSGSLTRMFTGLKRIVGNKVSNSGDCDESGFSTPGSVGSLGKRKNAENSSISGLLAKKKRVINSLPDGALLATPLRCRMHGYVAPVLASEESVVPNNLKKAKPTSPCRKARNRRNDNNNEENKNSTTSIVRKCLTRKEKTMTKMGSSSSIGNIFSIGHHKTSLDRRLSVISWSRKKTLNNLFLNKSEPNHEDEEFPENAFDSLDDSELITVHKSEYEDIKNRVLALEEELENLNSAHSVQTAYEKTLEESEKINSGSAEQLARRISKELKIRRSLENNIIRSPSARKIGSIRRRSRESLQRSMEHKTGLKRGRPNTVQSGLPSPGSRRFLSSSEVDGPSCISVPLRKEISENYQIDQMEWQSGDQFFAREYLLQKLLPTQQGRPSIVEIRNQNAGMVLEKAKLFNALNQADTDKSGAKKKKRQSIRIESLRQIKEIGNSPNKFLSRSNSLGLSNSKDLFQSSEGEDRAINQKSALRYRSLKNNTPSPDSSSYTQKKQAPLPSSPLSEAEIESPSSIPTPNIKKCLNTRSPRYLTKTPINQLKSGSRNRATPLRLAVDPSATPRIGVRRSPRILARSLTSSPRPYDQSTKQPQW